MKLFLDTNILIDLVAERKPFARWAVKIFKDAHDQKWSLNTSSFSILTTHYMLEKHVGDAKSRELLKVLLNRVSVHAISEDHLVHGLESNFRDYEDSVLYECAKSCQNIDYIITRNIKDFRQSAIPVISPEELYM